MDHAPLRRIMEAPTSVVGSPLSILVAEHASSSLEWLDRSASGQLSFSSGQVAPDVIVVSQQASEPAAAFASRVTHRIARLDAAKRPVTRAVLACGPRSDDAALSARVQTAQALLASLQDVDSATLTLAAPAGADPRIRHELMAIAGALLEGVHGRGPDIRVHFGSPAPRRAPHPAVSKKVA
jgi:hypothetical protein